MAALTVVRDNERPQEPLTGQEVLGELVDVLARGLPRVPLDDPVRAHLARFATAVGVVHRLTGLRGGSA